MSHTRSGKRKTDVLLRGDDMAHTEACWLESLVRVLGVGLFHMIISLWHKRCKSNGPLHLKTLASL